MKKRLNLKRLLSKRNKSGFTLIEVIIAMALLGILVTGVVMFASPILTQVSNNKKNAQANMLSESINTYIMGNIKSAKVVEIFGGQNLDYIMENGLDDPGGYGGNITALISSFPDYEVRCIGMVWLDDESATGAGRKKLMLVNCKVNNSLKILSYEKVFDDSLYSGLYPTLHIGTVESSSGGISDNGYEIVSKIYLSPSCYSAVSTSARNQNGPNFTGTTYVQCVNLSPAYTKMEHIYSTNYTPGPRIPSMVSKEELYAREEECLQNSIDHWYDLTADTDPENSNGFYQNGNHYFYTDTFIYYLAPL